jgi:hypothetical protein
MMAMKDMKDALRHIQQRLDELASRYEDLAIGVAWVKLAKAKPTEHVTTSKGVELEIRRQVTGANKVAYTAYLNKGGDRVAWMHCMAPMYGRVQVTNANVYELDGTDYRRHGIGTAIYDVIEADVRTAGGSGLEPHWGSMNEEAIAFCRSAGRTRRRTSPSSIGWGRRWRPSSSIDEKEEPPGLPTARKSGRARDRALLLLGACLTFLLLLVLLVGAEHDLAIEWHSLEQQVEPVAILVCEAHADVQPEVVLVLALDDGVGAIRWFRHDGYLQS